MGSTAEQNKSTLETPSGKADPRRLFSATIDKRYATRKESSQLLQLLPILYLRK
jgi:hypothetical protein